jgi:hypothetical protein
LNRDNDPLTNYLYFVGVHSDMNASMQFEDAVQFPLDNVGVNNKTDESFTMGDIMLQNSVANLDNRNGAVNVASNAAAELTNTNSNSGGTLFNRIKNIWNSQDDDDDSNNARTNQNNVPSQQSPQEEASHMNHLSSASQHSSQKLIASAVQVKSPA